MKTAFVIQRFGEGIDGGAETLCREITTRLAARGATVEVLTTCARDYLTWRNELPEGVATENGVRVRRFPVSCEREPESFGMLSELLFRHPHGAVEEERWMDLQGPVAPGVVEAVREGGWDVVVFFTYLYWTTVRGLEAACGPALLAPALHDEPPARLGIFRRVFAAPSGFVWNTREEREAAERLYDVRAPGWIAGSGVTAPEAVDPGAFAAREGLGRYLLYLGRIDVAKGVPELLRHFRSLRAREPGVELVLAGRLRMELADEPGVRCVGYLDETAKWEALAGAEAVVMPSMFESLSIVALESWAAGTPVLVNGQSPVLDGQVSRSGGGIAYRGVDDFLSGWRRLRENRGELSARGRAFVEAECGWDRVIDVWTEALETAGGVS